MTTMASQITSLTVVYSIIYSGADQRKINAPCHWPLCGEFTGIGEFPAQRASNAENVSIWWHHEAGALHLGMNTNMDFNICFSNTGHRYYNIWKNISYFLSWHILEVLAKRETSTCIQGSILQVFSKYIAQLYPTFKIKYPDLEN